MATSLTHRTKQFLREGGWHARRRIDTTRFVTAFRSEHVFVGDLAVEFLAQFGDLAIRYPHFRAPGREDGCHFDAQRAVANVGSATISKYERILSRRLTPIGEAYSDHMTLVMDETGAVYGGFEGTLVNIGDSGIDALNTLCEGREGQIVDYDVEKVRASPRTWELGIEARRRLSEGGWHACRRLLAGDIDQKLAKLGHRPSRTAKQFLLEFDGISITCPAWNDAAEEEICHFRADICNGLPSTHYSEYRRQLGQDVAVVGELEESGVVLIMMEDGTVLAGMREIPDIAWHVGDSGYDAINSLCERWTKKRIL